MGLRATKLTLSLTLSLTLAPTLTLPLTQARCVELFGNESDAEALARLRAARPGVDVAWKQSAREGAEAEADGAGGAAGATVPRPVLTRTPRNPRTVGTGYARLPPACGTYPRRRAACPGWRGGEMCTVRIPASALGRAVQYAPPTVAPQVATGMSESAPPAPATSHDVDDVDDGGGGDDDDVPPDPGGSW